MTAGNGAGFASAIHGYYAHYVDNADAKAGALLTVDFAVGGLLLANIPSSCGARTASWVAVAFLSVSVLACLHAIFPRLPGRATGVIFWEDVHRFPSAPEYAAAATRLSADEVEVAWAVNAFHVAGVLHRKFWGIRVALVTTVAGLVAGAISLPVR